MDILKELAQQFWSWLPKSQLYGALGLAVVLWLVRQYTLSRFVLVVAVVAWVVGFAVSQSNVVAGVGPNVLYVGMLAGAGAAVAIFWFVFLRNP
jgi:hypothetical protein